jgi:hypothetical protein
VTARELYDRLSAAGVLLTVDGRKLLGAGDIPAELVEYVEVLASGLRAIVTGRPWWGSRSDKPGLEVLPLDQRIPEYITKLCVEGDGKWGRIKLWLPELYRGGKRDVLPREDATTAAVSEEADANAIPF